MSTEIALTVFAAVNPSAPASTAARATSTSLSVFGDSLAKTGFLVADFTAFTTLYTTSGWCPTSVPTPATWGQLRFSSYATKSLPSRASVTALNSPPSPPKIETMTGRDLSLKAASSSENLTAPGLGRPAAFTIPESTSAKVGSGYPSLGSGPTD